MTRRFVIPPAGERVTVSTRSARGTKAVAEAISRVVEGGTVLALAGELGAGKTSFVQGLAAGLGVPELGQVLSPTYTLVNEYLGGRLTLVHIDFYRLAGADAARGLGIEEQIGRAGALTAIEWADLLPEMVPADAVWIQLQPTAPGARRIVIGRGKPDAP